ncbi:MAG: hydrogenase nickel incorporation protein HypB [Pseudomonadota bacterium]
MGNISVEEDLLASNSRVAAENRRRCTADGVCLVNLMSSPGAGKTTLLERTAVTLRDRLRWAVVAGDIETRRDADRIARHGIPVVQLNTAGACHLEAGQVATALSELSLERLDLVIVENVGNLVCPAEFDLGEHHKVMILSVAEGHDKPGKYPLMFRESRLMVLSKVDLLPYTDFDEDKAIVDARSLNPALEILRVSARTGVGLDEWCGWLAERTVEVQVRGRQ